MKGIKNNVMTRQSYNDNLRTLADTILYEKTIEIVKYLEQNKNCQSHECHWQNGLVYSEFWRRGKASIYYMAHNQCQLMLGRSFGVVSGC